MSHIDALDTTAVLARTRTEEEEEEEGEGAFLPAAATGETRTPEALQPSTTISSTFAFSAILPPCFSIPRTRASTMAFEPPTG